MKYNSFAFSHGTQSTVETEILYNIASARANKVEILRFSPSQVENEKALSAAIRVLRGLKKQGKIRLFILSQDLFSDSTEAEYLRNKYPDISEICDEKEKTIIVMV